LDEWVFSTTLTRVIGVQRSCPLECKLDGPSRHQRRPVHLCAACFTLLKLDSGGVECCDYWIRISIGWSKLVVEYIFSVGNLECGGSTPLWPVATCRNEQWIVFETTGVKAPPRPKRRRAAALQNKSPGPRMDRVTGAQRERPTR
jgi:hypothetical protein